MHGVALHQDTSMVTTRKVRVCGKQTGMCGPCAACGSKESTIWKHYSSERTLECAVKLASTGCWEKNPSFVPTHKDCFCTDRSCFYLTIHKVSTRWERSERHVTSLKSRRIGRYPTQHSEMETLCATLDISGHILDCCGGIMDTISLFLSSRGCHVTTNDIDPARNAHSHHDASTKSYWSTLPKYDWVITSPPFSRGHQTSDIVRHAIDHCYVGVCMRMQLAYLHLCRPLDHENGIKIGRAHV